MSQVFRSRIDPGALARQRALNRLQSGLLLAAIIGLAAVAGYGLAGSSGVLFGIGMAAGLLLFGSTSGDGTFRHLYGALPLTVHHAPGLVRLLHDLARRAGLGVQPQLYLLPSPVLQAMAYGTRQRPAIAVTSGLVRALPSRELAAVLAHEVAHLRHGDLFIMRLAQTAGSLTSAMANTGMILLILLLPLAWSAGVVVSPLAVLLLLAAPLISDLLQRSLSRRREFLADAGAAELTGDPVGMIQALERLHMIQGDDWERFASRGGRWLHWFRTHPPLRERVERLASMTQLHPVAIPIIEEAQLYPGRRGNGPQRLVRRVMM
ncbi:MAG TPA: zinc metalloprotease HtpX [Geminicoccus sp.]|uniref:zinc metalloprotease HtpX n=1 Tax=Geminicoccus sp. TaxID=2024832 RepID=UPI002E36C7A8|nr:zinc metalloprotease HtpX [Geminicoccus sp.]HEX2526693.1 zinc metalloprotease HtpX [Geminicoccus sp.]